MSTILTNTKPNVLATEPERPILLVHSEEEHVEYVRKILKRLLEAELYVDLEHSESRSPGRVFRLPYYQRGSKIPLNGRSRSR